MIRATIAAAALCLSAAAASAETGIKLGVLSCQVDGGVGYLITSSKDLACIYRTGSGRRERYSGTIRNFGVDLGVTGQSAFVWAVFAPGKVKRGGLEGYYGGATAEATVIVGLGAHALVGGFKKTVNLQPLSLQAQTGLNVAAAITGLRLDYEGR